MLDRRALIRDEARESLYKISRVIGFHPARNRYRVRRTNLPPRAGTFEPVAQIPRHLVDTFRCERHLPALPAEVWNGHSTLCWGRKGYIGIRKYVNIFLLPVSPTDLKVCTHNIMGYY